jgi:hypothetical protein
VAVHGNGLFVHLTVQTISDHFISTIALLRLAISSDVVSLVLVEPYAIAIL